MRNHVEFLLVVLSVAALSLFLIPDRGTSLQKNVTSYDDVALAELFNKGTAIFLPNAGGNPSGIGTSWVFAAKKHDDGTNGHEGDEEGEEKDDKGGGGGGFDRLWEVVCCG
jgi:hypothetical protein